MRIEFLNQSGTLEFNIKKKYVVFEHTNEKGEAVEDMYIKPVEGSIAISCDSVVIDTATLKLTDIMEYMRVKELFDEKERKAKKHAE